MELEKTVDNTINTLKMTTQKLNCILPTPQFIKDTQTTKISETISTNLDKTHEEYQYLNLIENILENGVWEEGRNGRTQSIFGASMRFSLKDNKIPILTTKKNGLKYNAKL